MGWMDDGQVRVGGWQNGQEMWENRSGWQASSGEWRGKEGVSGTDRVGVSIKDEGGVTEEGGSMDRGVMNEGAVTKEGTSPMSPVHTLVGVWMQ